MNIYKVLNEMIDYIEQNLEQKIEYRSLSQIMGINENTMQRLFSIICECSIADYIRNRRLTKAGADLFKRKLYST